jgi:pyruvate formate lyase activating enzyme
MVLSASPTATILHLQRLSTEDGPGIRTTVFFKGCPLHCTWCHNPESISPVVQIHWLENRCIGDRACLSACPRGALSFPDSHGLFIDRALCSACDSPGSCTEACPTGALERLGRPAGVADLTGELLKDVAYYRTSGGGVTLSGGEPSLQADFAVALLAALRQAGVHTALDTCGLCSRETLAKLLEHTDLLLFDIKAIDPGLHQSWTGVSNTRILDNLAWLAHLPARPALWVRTPLIPGSTASPENLRTIGAWLEREIPGQVERWELCGFNNLCRDKYRRLGQEWPFAAIPLFSTDELQELAAVARTGLRDPALVSVSGPTRP